MPVSVNKTLGANDRCSPSGAVISAFLLAVIEGDMIIGWMKNSAFSVQQQQRVNGRSAPGRCHRNSSISCPLHHW
jgi:hypothetical protein